MRLVQAKDSVIGLVRRKLWPLEVLCPERREVLNVGVFLSLYSMLEREISKDIEMEVGRSGFKPFAAAGTVVGREGATVVRILVA